MPSHRTAGTAVAALRAARRTPYLASGERAHMRILVLGGGIAGVTAAYYLAKDGHEVTLVEEHERRRARGERGQRRHHRAGPLVRVGVAQGARDAPSLAPRAETAIRVRPRLDPALFAWGLRFLRECTAARARRNTIVKLGLCQYSQAVMADLVRARASSTTPSPGARSISTATRASWRRAFARWRCSRTTDSARRSWTPARWRGSSPRSRPSRRRSPAPSATSATRAGIPACSPSAWRRSAGRSWG